MSELRPTSSAVSTREFFTRLIPALIAIGLLGLIAAPHFANLADEDSGNYQKLMLNHWSEVHQPFSSRFLHAETVWLIGRITHTSVYSAVVGVAIAALVLSVLGFAWIMARLNAPPLLLLPVIVCCGFMETFRLAWMPDLFYTLLLIVLFLLLMSRRFLLSAGMIFVLFCARESTVVLGVVLVILSTKWLRAPDQSGEQGGEQNSLTPWAFFAATVVGFFFNRYVTSKSAGNLHEMSGAMYIIGKLPFNFLKNVMGIEPWTNTLVATEGDHPLRAWPVPHWVHLGAINRVGISTLSARYPLGWLTNTICMFGVLLPVVFRQWAMHANRAGEKIIGRFVRLRAIIAGFKVMLLREPFYSRVALLYGLISLAIVPILGTAVHRYIYYAWPAFWITGVLILLRQYFQENIGPSRSSLWQLLVLHLILVWMPVLLGLSNPYWISILGLLIVAIVLHVLAWKVLARSGFAAV